MMADLDPSSGHLPAPAVHGHRSKATSYFVGLILEAPAERALAKLIASIAHQTGINDTAVAIGVKSCDGIDYAPLVRDSVDRCGSSRQLDIFHAPDRSKVSLGAGHNGLSEMARAAGFGRYVGLRADGLLHHGALYHLTRKWAATRGDALVELRLFPKEHPKTYDPATGETPWCCGASFSISPEVLRSVGGFDAHFGRFCGDVDLSWRLRLDGHACHIAPDALFSCDLSTEAGSHADKLEQLNDGRRLAWKWRHAAFQASMEDQLIALGAGREPRDLTPPAGEPVDAAEAQAEGICDFRHGFQFAFPRW